MSALWIDKHRPNTLNKLTLHPEISQRLESLAKCEDIPHLLFYGPPGAGKKTRVMALLREIYGPNIEKTKLEHRLFKTATGKNIEISMIGSAYHLEVCPAEVGNNDRFVIQEVIKEIASHSNITASVGAAGARTFKILVLTEVDRLSKQAQAGLRRTMERYSAQCRLVLVCSSLTKVIEPIRSRCMGVRVSAPSVADLSTLLMQVAKKEGVSLSPDFALRLAEDSDRNTRKALLMLETARVGTGGSAVLTGEGNTNSLLPDWQLYIHAICREILSEQSPSKLLQVREMLYELLSNCIPADVILLVLIKELCKNVDDGVKHETVHWGAEYAHRLCMGSKDIFHLEAFVCKFMSIYKKWIVSMFG